MRALVMIAAVLATEADGQEIRSSTDIVSTRPAIGEATLVSSGEALWVFERTPTTASKVQKIQLSEKVKIGNFMKGMVIIPADAEMTEKPIRSGIAACTKLNMAFGRRHPCLYDMDKDGSFEAVSFSDDGDLENLTAPVRYDRVVVEQSFEAGRTFRSVIIYLGSNGSSLSLSYREFVDGLARPAFTEELPIPLGKDFPQNVRVKGVTFQISKIDGMGINYRVVASSRSD